MISASGSLRALADVDHQQALVHVDLRGRQADAGRGVHGLEHVVDQLAQRCVDLLDGLGAGAQSRIGKFENGK